MDISSADAEAKFIAASVKDWIDSGIAPSEIGIAVRAKWLSSKIEQRSEGGRDRQRRPGEGVR